MYEVGTFSDEGHIHKSDAFGGGMLVSYQQYGISPELVERVRAKMKNKVIKERVMKVAEAVTKEDLQNRAKIQKLIDRGSKITGVKVSPAQAEALKNFIIAQKINPKNTLHLIRLWRIFG